MSAMRQPMNPPSASLHSNGEKFSQPSAFKLLKDGADIISNRLFDPVFIRDFSRLPEDVQKELVKSWLLTSTLIVKNEDGKPLGEKIVFSDGNCSVTS